MNCTPKVVATVTAYVTDKTQPLATIAAALNAPQFDNPTPQAQIVTPFDFNTIAPLIGAISMGKLTTYIHFDQVIFDMRNRDRAAVLLWASALAAAPLITPDEATAIQKALMATVPDPDWKPKLSWIEKNFNVGDVLTQQDISASAWIAVSVV